MNDLISFSTIEKKCILNVADIRFLLSESLREEEPKFPDYVNFELLKGERVLVISLKAYLSPLGMMRYSCANGMHRGDSSFEGWALALKLRLSAYIDTVLLQWDIPSDNELKSIKLAYYERFLYRVFHFSEMFAWFEVGKSNLKALEPYRSPHIGLVNNKAAGLLKISAKEEVEAASVVSVAENLQILKSKFKLSIVKEQLSVEIRKGKKTFFPMNGVCMDSWGVNNRNQLCLFKVGSRGSNLGMISKLLFYSEVMYDILIAGRISNQDSAEESEEERLLYKMDAIEGINGYFLFDDLPPLVRGVSSLLNTNRYGLEFFNIHYQLKEGSSVIDHSRLVYKGGLQLEEEHRQSLYRKKASLPGSGYILQAGEDNLCDRMPEAVEYFKDSSITWLNMDNVPRRTPSTYMLSSQAQCVNYLFPLHTHKEAVLQLAKLFDSSIDEVLPTLLPSYGESYIDFGFVYHNDRILGEKPGYLIRGGVWTSTDACIMARRGSEKVLILIEWKYTEGYFDRYDYITNVHLWSRWTQYMQQSEQLLDLSVEPDYYRYEPFFELMRQTLLAEGIVREGVADDYLHVLVAPGANRDLFGNRLPFAYDNVEATWKCCLKQPDKFKMVDSREIMETVVARFSPVSALYLRDRYSGIV